MAGNVSRAEIMDVLKTVSYPGLSRNIVDFGMVKGLEHEGGQWRIRLKITTADPSIVAKIEAAIRQALASGLGLDDIIVDKEVVPPKVRGGGAPGGKGAAPQNANLIPGVTHKIAVASGKGGVGKSTVACNLAVALAQEGHSVGLLDADIYGPSQPMMMGVMGDKPEMDGPKLLPIEKYGIKIMSIGFFLKEDGAVIWRGPMVMKAIEQFLRDVEWGELDYLIVDLPPGTGDAQLSLSQLIVLTGAVIVTTPQDVALLDAVKGVQMFQRVNVPIVGIIENMSYYLCTECGHRAEIFSHGGAQRACEKLQVPFLGEIPLDIRIREGGDHGKPVVDAASESPEAEAFRQVARAVTSSASEAPVLKISL